MKWLVWHKLGGAALALVLPLALWAQAPAPKVFRYAFPIAETGFDPAQISDIYSRTVTPHIFEAPYTYDHLARPALLKPDRKSTRLNSSHRP